MAESDEKRRYEEMIKNTYDLNELLGKFGIAENLRSQFTGICILVIKNGLSYKSLDALQISEEIKSVLKHLLECNLTENSEILDIFQKVLDSHDISSLSGEQVKTILDFIKDNILTFANGELTLKHDLLNRFFTYLNKYTGKADKNQAFTPDHITNLMCRVTSVDRTKRIFDGTCGSGSFLVQAMVQEMIDCNRQKVTEAEKQIMREKVAKEHIYGVEIEEKAFGLSTTNMLIHGDGNSNIKHGNLFENEKFFRLADPDIILMNPPYNAKPINIPEAYKKFWKSDTKEDPTKGLVFLKYISDIVAKINNEFTAAGKHKKEIKLAILLPVAVAIGNNSFISDMKKEILEENTLEAVFTLPNEIFYPGASASACCMVFTLGRPHVLPDGTTPKTFFGYFKDDGHKKKKNLGRVEQFDSDNNSIWKKIEEEWLDLYRNKTVKDGISAMQAVSGEDEWLCEAYMKTDFSKLTDAVFQKPINNYLAYQIKEGKFIFNDKQHNKVINKTELDLLKWKEFYFGDLISDIYKAKAINKDELSENSEKAGSIRYITRTAENNGCEMLAIRSDVADCLIEKGNAITIGDTTATCFYQDEEFITGDHMVVIRADSWLNKYTGLFIVAILQCEQYKYSYDRAFIMEKIKNTIIKLPADKDGKPDWNFMENYIKSLSYGDRI